MKVETGWLIEHVKDPRFGRESWYAGKDGFDIDSLKAIRFARKEDALRMIDRFPVSLGKRLIATEHSWGEWRTEERFKPETKFESVTWTGPMAETLAEAAAMSGHYAPLCPACGYPLEHDGRCSRCIKPAVPKEALECTPENHLWRWGWCHTCNRIGATPKDGVCPNCGEGDDWEHGVGWRGECVRRGTPWREERYIGISPELEKILSYVEKNLETRRDYMEACLAVRGQYWKGAK